MRLRSFQRTMRRCCPCAASRKCFRGCARSTALTSRCAAAAFGRLDVEVEVTEPLNIHSLAVQQLVAIARALDIRAKALVLGEPTSSLDAHEVERLFAVLRKLKAQGLGIIFVSHFLDQVYAIADRFTVLRNGKLIGEYEATKLPRLELVA